MSEEQRITKVEKEKDPRRVEAGKRLAAISRVAKERKAARQHSEAERMERIVEEPTENTHDEGYSTITILTGVGILSGLICLYFTYRQDRRATAASAATAAETSTAARAATPQPQQQQRQQSNKLRSFDD